MSEAVLRQRVGAGGKSAALNFAPAAGPSPKAAVDPLPAAGVEDARRFLIVTADDFGASLAVNEAVEQAYCHGVLTAASLMVGGAAATDAVARARRLPGLRVGLHLTLTDGLATLPAAEIPALASSDGRFHHVAPWRLGWRHFASPSVRRQVAAEIRAQFEAFARTGLVLDRVDSHHHLLLHPTLSTLTLAIGRDYGLAAVRVPQEPDAARGLAPLHALLRRRLRRAGVAANDRVYGLRHSGAMDEAALLAVLAHLPAGVSELYLHPSLEGPGTVELAALLSPRVRAAVAASGVGYGGYREAFRQATA